MTATAREVTMHGVYFPYTSTEKRAATQADAITSKLRRIFGADREAQMSEEGAYLKYVTDERKRSDKGMH